MNRRLLALPAAALLAVALVGCIRTNGRGVSFTEYLPYRANVIVWYAPCYGAGNCWYNPNLSPPQPAGALPAANLGGQPPGSRKLALFTGNRGWTSFSVQYVGPGAYTFTCLPVDVWHTKLQRCMDSRNLDMAAA